MVARAFNTGRKSYRKTIDPRPSRRGRAGAFDSSARAVAFLFRPRADLTRHPVNVRASCEGGILSRPWGRYEKAIDAGNDEFLVARRGCPRELCGTSHARVDVTANVRSCVPGMDGGIGGD